MQFQFSEGAWREYLDWQTKDRRTLKKINDLLQDISRGGYQGIGKPEQLKGDLSSTGAVALTIKTGLFIAYKVMYAK